MTEKLLDVNTGVAPLQNLRLAYGLMDKAKNLPTTRPRMVMLFGRSGTGKSSAAGHVAQKFDAFHLEAKSFWTGVTFLEALLEVMGISTKDQPGTKAKKAKLAIDQLMLANKPLVIDEMDHIVDNKFLELVRDIYEGSQIPILMIGEERLIGKIRRFSERFYGRILKVEKAKPCDLVDAKQLAQFHYPDIRFDDDLLLKVIEATKGSARLITVNLDEFNEIALSKGKSSIGLKDIKVTALRKGEHDRRVV